MQREFFLLSDNGQCFSEFTNPNEGVDDFLDVVEEIKAKHTHISYNSLQGQMNPRTLKFITIINNCKIYVLLNLGSAQTLFCVKWLNF